MTRAWRWTLRVIMVVLVAGAVAGCWDNREPRRRAYVLSLAVDQVDDDPDQLLVTLQIPLPHTGGDAKGTSESGTIDYFLIQGRGTTLVGAFQNAQDRLSRELFFGQMRSLILSSQLDPAKIRQLADGIRRNPDLEETVYLTVARGRAEDLIRVKSVQEKLPAMYFNAVYESVRRMTISFPVQAWEYWRTYHSPGWQPVLPVAEPVGQDEVRFAGLAVYRGPQFRGFLNPEEAQGFLWLVGRTNNRTISLALKDGPAAVRSLGGSRSISVRFERSRPVFLIAVRIRGEVALSPWTTLTEKEILLLERQVTDAVREQVNRALHKIQEEYQSDILGLGNLLFYRFPTYFDRVDWDEVFHDVRIEPDVQVSLSRKGMLH